MCWHVLLKLSLRRQAPTTIAPGGGGGHLIDKSDILAAGAGILTVQSSKIQNARGLLEGGNDEVSS